MRTSHGRVQTVFLCLLRQAEGAACVYLRGGGDRVLLRGKQVWSPLASESLAKRDQSKAGSRVVDLLLYYLWCEQ